MYCPRVARSAPASAKLDGHVATGTDAEHDPPSGGGDRRQHRLGDGGRRAERDHEHVGPDRDPLRAAGEDGHAGDPVDVVGEVVAGPDRVEADLLGGAAEVLHGDPGPTHVHRAEFDPLVSGHVSVRKTKPCGLWKEHPARIEDGHRCTGHLARPGLAAQLEYGLADVSGALGAALGTVPRRAG